MEVVKMTTSSTVKNENLAEITFPFQRPYESTRGPLLLTWFIFNPSMDMWSHAQ